MTQCVLCSLGCRLGEGETGRCGVITFTRGRIVNPHASRALFATATPTEAIPLYHFYPGSRALTLWTIGCPPRCTRCPYRAVSGDLKSSSLRSFNAEDLVDLASRQRASVFMVNGGECMIHEGWIRKVLDMARNRGLATAVKTLGMSSPDTYRRLSSVVNAVIVEHTLPLRKAGFTMDVQPPSSYRDIINTFDHVEVIVPYVRGIGFNEYVEDPAVRELPEVDREVPIHILPYSEAETRELYRLRELMTQLGMRYVYIPRDPLLKYVNTYCWNCGGIVIERDNLGLVRSLLKENACPHCNSKIRVVGRILEEKWRMFRLLAEEIVW